MLGAYREVLRTPGSPAFVLAGVVARLPMAMEAIGVVLLITLTGGSYTLAGGLASLLAVTAALVGPWTSRLADRRGQHLVLPVLAVSQSLLLVLLVLAVARGAEVPALVLLAALAGAVQPNVGSMVRARWASALAGASRVRVAFALESVVDELIYVVGPLVATALAVGLVPEAGVLAAAVLLLVGGLSLAAQRRTQPVPVRAHPAEGAGPRAPRMSAGVPLLAVIFVFVGAQFGVLEVAIVAFSRERDIAWASGVLLACFAVGSAVGGLAFGARMAGRDLPRQLLLLLVVTAVATLPFPVVGSPVILGALGMLAGALIAPILICGFTLAAGLVAEGRTTEAITWVSSGIGVGFAVAATLTGVVADARGASPSFAVSIASATLAALVCAASLGVLRRSWAARPAQGIPD